MPSRPSWREPIPATAYDLCERTCEILAVDPVHYNQADWVREVSRVRNAADPTVCGTAFCRGGWMDMILTGKCFSSLAADVGLGLRTPENKFELAEVDAFSMAVAHLFQAEALAAVGLPIDAKPGTREYAAAGIDGLRTFMTRWEDRLRATPIDYAQVRAYLTQLGY